MPRIPRIVLPGVPHHATQRGSRRMNVFLERDDYRRYLRLLADQARKEGVAVWAYCLMPNHVHLIVVPESRTGLAKALGRAHRGYALGVNRRSGWRGHLWQERFWSCAMDDRHLQAAVGYVLLNPVRAGLVERAEHWPHSSAAALLEGRADPIADSNALRRRLGAERVRLNLGCLESDLEALRQHTASGRPIAS